MAVKPEKEARETEVGFTASCEELVNSTPKKRVWITLLRTPAFFIYESASVSAEAGKPCFARGLLPAAVCLSRPKPFGCPEAALTGSTAGRYFAVKQNKA